jgi:hypothetical protein
MTYRTTAGRILAAAGSLLGGLGLATVVAAQPPVGGFLGQPLETAKQSAFFGWFHLAQVGSIPAGDGAQVLTFKPTGDKFHELTTVEVTLNPDGTVRRMDLILSRSFIDDPNDGVFARDIAKSFLHDAPSTDDAAAMANLSDEIQYRFTPRTPVLMGPGAHTPDLSAVPSDGYLAFAGERKSYSRNLAHSVVTIENASRNNGGQRADTLRIGLSPASPDA